MESSSYIHIIIDPRGKSGRARVSSKASRRRRRGIYNVYIYTEGKVLERARRRLLITETRYFCIYSIYTAVAALTRRHDDSCMCLIVYEYIVFRLFFFLSKIHAETHSSLPASWQKSESIFTPMLGGDGDVARSRPFQRFRIYIILCCVAPLLVNFISARKSRQLPVETRSLKLFARSRCIMRCRFEKARVYEQNEESDYFLGGVTQYCGRWKTAGV